MWIIGLHAACCYSISVEHYRPFVSSIKSECKLMKNVGNLAKLVSYKPILKYVHNHSVL